MAAACKGTVFNIQKYSIHDGPGIRTTVFLKGCPLKCQWCHNPESQLVKPQIMYSSSVCKGCGGCVTACQQHCFTLNDEQTCDVDFTNCMACGACVHACPCGAISLAGEPMDAKEIIDVAEKDRKFYETSGGGVTISGGEPLFQPDMLVALLEECRKRALHTAVETCGYASEEIARRIFPLTDMILFDCKHMDPAQHKLWTGRDNETILRNLRIAAEETDAKLWIRLPLIAGVNDSEENQEALIAFLTPMKARVDAIWLLPFHRLGISKLASMGMSTEPQEGFGPPSEARLAQMLERFEKAGFVAKRG